MKFYLAPLEGITGYIYRTVYQEYFRPMDKYFTPFLVPNQNKTFKSRELNDVDPRHNSGLKAVPQLLTSSAEDFIWAALELKKLGYDEINLNLGCPSGTVVAKRKGAGFLAVPDELDRFLETVFSAVDIGISVKTRTGIESHEEFPGLLQIFNRYPLTELIVHPRTRNDFYKNKPNLEVFGEAVEKSSNPVCYNGDIWSPEDYEQLCGRFPQLKVMMIGRGVLANPGLTEFICSGNNIEKPVLRQFHDRLCREYTKELSGDQNILFKMKELWHYMGRIFEDPSKHLKKIKKAQRMKDYMAAVDRIFEEREIASRTEVGAFYR